MPRPLPTELIRHIIKLALPVVSYRTYKERYDLLLSFSLVNSTWNALAQEELYKEVFVKTGEKLVAVLEGRESQLGRRVHLGTNISHQDPHLKLLGFPTTLDGVTTITVSYMCICADLWPSFEGLETLHMYHVDLEMESYAPKYSMAPRPSGSVFRSLTTLSFIDVFLQEEFPSWTTWFTPANLPHLQCLTICILGDDPLGNNDDFVQALEHLAPQIQHFTVNDGMRILLSDGGIRWSAFTAIERLALYLSNAGDAGAELTDTLAQLPPGQLSHLLVGYAHGDMQGWSNASDFWWAQIIAAVEQALEADPGSFPELRTLVVHLADEEIKEKRRELMEKLDGVMQKRGGTLERRVGWGERKGLLRWERYLEVW